MGRKISKRSVKQKTKKRPIDEYVTYFHASLAEEVALYYGFFPTETPTITRDDLTRSKTVASDSQKSNCLDNDKLAPQPEEKAAIIRTFEEKGWYKKPQPIMLFLDWSRKDRRGDDAGHDRRFDLEILGAPKSIAEAILIKTAYEVLREEGFENLYVDLNSLGDRESLQKFVRDLTSYYRRNLASLPAHCRQTMKRNVCDLLACKDPQCQALIEDAPKPIASLTEQSRNHFTEVLEFLEMINIPYRINDRLIVCKEFSGHTIFKINTLDDGEKEERALALGLRYNQLAKKIGWKRELPAVGVTLAYRKKTGHEHDPKRIKMKKPKIYFIQLGFDAKLKSLKIIETLRQFKVPLVHALAKDKLAAQIASAETEKIPYTMIIGQKEARENTIIVRDMSNRSQTTVKVEELPAYLKKLKLAS